MGFWTVARRRLATEAELGGELAADHLPVIRSGEHLLRPPGRSAGVAELPVGLGLNADGVPVGGRSAAGPQGATSVASPSVAPETGRGPARQPRMPGGDASNSKAKRTELFALSALCLLLLVLFITKTFVLDSQNLLRVSRFGQAVAVFDGQLELLAGESDAGEVARGGDVYARFYWRPALALTKDYHVFAQLIGADGSAIAGSDKQHPGDPVVQGETPTSQLALGTYLRDEHIIHVPVNAPPGRYELKVGLYDPQTGKRLKLPSGESMAGVVVIELK